MNIVSRIIIAALAAFAFSVAAQDAPPPANCAEAEGGFVNGVPCFSFGGRMYAKEPGQGIEASAILGSLPSAPPSGILYVPVTERFGHTIAFDVTAGHPDLGTLALIRFPARVAGDDAENASVRTDHPTDAARQLATSLVGQDGERLAWGSLPGGQWRLIARVPDGWALLN